MQYLFQTLSSPLHKKKSHCWDKVIYRQLRAKVDLKMHFKNILRDSITYKQRC